jgi:hypothetical protein
MRNWIILYAKGAAASTRVDRVRLRLRHRSSSRRERFLLRFVSAPWSVDVVSLPLFIVLFIVLVLARGSYTV